ncbi:MAG: hydrogenase 4 subunit H [Enterobacteriaceae bacterium]|nr:hydrogenase 4 subunit H [Enterobacteriaceae bacterium]
MLKLLKTIIKAGDVTEKYPFKPYEVSDNFRGKPEYNAEQCIACAACTMACPANALTMSTDTASGERKWLFFLGRCIFCGRCEEVCPTKAIRLSQEFELAVFNKQDLFQEAIFQLTDCRVCQRPFAPRKSIEHAIALLVQSGLSLQEAEARRPLFETCPNCKRQQNVTGSPTIFLGQHINQERKEAAK